MSNGKGTAIGIIAIIIGVSGFGMSTYTVLKYDIIGSPVGPQGPPGLDGLNGTDGIDGIDGINGTLNNLVAIWESAYGVSTPAPDFFIELADLRLNNSEFFFTSLSNTSVNLTRAGWYKFNVRILLSQLVEYSYYVICIEKNGVLLERLDHVQASPEPYYQISSFVYVYSNGSAYFRFRCYSSGYPFDIYPDQTYNQVVLEYVGEP